MQTGPYVANDDLARASLLPVGMGKDAIAPETVVVGPRDGLLYTGLANGSIVRLDPRTARVQRVAEVGPRPLGMVFRPDGTLLVADGTGTVRAITVTPTR